MRALSNIYLIITVTWRHYVGMIKVHDVVAIKIDWLQFVIHHVTLSVCFKGENPGADINTQCRSKNNNDWSWKKRILEDHFW